MIKSIPQSPLVVGYKGEIGSFILSCLLKFMPKAMNIWCFDINESEKEKIYRIKKSDYIFLCVPLQDTIPWLRKYRKHLKNKIIVEQCSLKEPLFNSTYVKGLKIISMHILFRPSATSNTDTRNCILIYNNVFPVREDWFTFIEFISKITNSRVQQMVSPVSHDMAMSLQQALVHRVILALAHSISGVPGETFMGAKIKELARRMKSGNKTLYQMLQKNSYLTEVLGNFKKELDKFEI